MTDLRYPIGTFDYEAEVSEDEIRKAIRDIAETPAALRAAVSGLTDAQLDTPYRPDGWTVRQVVHHLPDSHLNAYVRIRLALTEDEPTIRPYDEAKWAELPDGRSAPVEMSLRLLDAVHERWIALLETTGPDDWKRTLRHPEVGVVTVGRMLAQYGWHGRHHVAHVTDLRERKGW